MGSVKKAILFLDLIVVFFFESVDVKWTSCLVYIEFCFFYYINFDTKLWQSML